MVRSDGGLRLNLGNVLGTSLIERPENGFRVLEIIMDDVDEEVCVHDIGDNLVWNGPRIIDASPLLSKFIRLILWCE